jgi:hypothetical protein
MSDMSAQLKLRGVRYCGFGGGACHCGQLCRHKDGHQEHQAVDTKTGVEQQRGESGSWYSIFECWAQIPSAFKPEGYERYSVACEVMELVV